MSRAGPEAPQPKRQKSPISRAKAWVLGRVLLLFCFAVRLVPVSIQPRLGDGAGMLLFLCSRKLRTVAINNLRQVYGGQWSDRQVIETARQVFRNFGRTAVEFVSLPSTRPERLRRIARIEGIEHLKAALSRGRGVIFLGAHYGNWELMAARLVLEGVTINVLARTADDSLTEQLVTRIRTRAGYHVYQRDASLVPVLRSLRQNQAIGVLLDQNFTTGVFVSFFGRLAATAPGAAKLALRTSTPVVSAFSERLPDNTHLIRLEPVEVVRTGDEQADVLANTQLFTSVIEDAVRRRPDQWMWFHNRWKLRPPDEERRGSEA